MKCYNTHTIGIPEGEERKGGRIFEEIIGETLPNLGKKTEIQIQEAERASNKTIPKRSTPRYIVIKMGKK